MMGTSWAGGITTWMVGTGAVMAAEAVGWLAAEDDGGKQGG
jgi:hypothetical protein